MSLSDAILISAAASLCQPLLFNFRLPTFPFQFMSFNFTLFYLFLSTFSFEFVFQLLVQLFSFNFCFLTSLLQLLSSSTILCASLSRDLLQLFIQLSTN